MTVGVANKFTGTLPFPSTETEVTANISLGDINKGVLFFTTQGESNNTRRDMFRGEITNATTITFNRQQAATDITIEWTVIEFSGDVTVNRGAISIVSTAQNITLSSLPEGQRWEIPCGSQYDRATSVGTRTGYIAQVTSPTNLQLSVIGAPDPDDSIASWQVVDFAQSADIEAQRGKVSFSSSDTSKVTNISPITLGQSIATVAGVEVDDANQARRWGFTVKFNSDSQIEHERGDAARTPNTSFVVLDCKWGAATQTGALALAGATVVDTVAISSVDNAKSIAIGAHDFVGHGGGRTDSGSSGVNRANVTIKFNSGTELELEKFDTGSVNTTQWYVLEIESGAVTPVLTIQDLDHAHDLEAPTITTETESDLTVQDLDHAHELESPTIFTEEDLTLVVQGLDHAHELESPTIGIGEVLTIQNVDHPHELESPQISLLDPFGGFARRKLAGTGLNYVQYPNTGNPENFRVDVGAKTLIVDEWHPNVVDGLTKCQVRLFRDSTLIRAVSYDQNVNGGQWNQLFLEEDPAAGDYFLRTMDDQQSGTGGTGTYVYADAFQVTIDAAPQLTPQPMVHLHTMSNIGLLSDYELQINNLDHSHQLEAPTISDVKVATAQDLDHGHLLDSPTITTDVQDALVVGDLTHSHDLEVPTVSYNFLSTVNDLDHGHELEQATITGELSLVIQDVDHGHDIESPTIATGDVAAAANLVHSQSIDNVVLESLSILPAVKELLHDGHQIDNVDLTYNQQLSLVIDDMTHNHVIDDATITTDPVLFIGSINHAHVVDSLELSAASGLQSNDMNHPHTIDTVDVFFEEDLPPLDRTYLVKPENINYIVKPESNTYVVK